MSRPIWKGSISFGLVTIPISLYTAEKPSEHQNFHMLDKRNKSRVRYERVNEETGKKVPWEDIVKGYEYEKGNYIILEGKELEELKDKGNKQEQSVEIQDFIEESEIEPIYLEKPYYLVPEKRGEKAYVLLRETLKKTNKIAVSKVFIRTKQYLSLVIPYQNGLLLELVRYPEEIVKIENMELPKGGIKEYNISKSEIQMAEKLISTMSKKWDPKRYKDESHAILQKLVERKIKKGKGFAMPEKEKEEAEPIRKSAKVINFMDLLKKSIDEKKKGKKAQESKGSKFKENKAAASSEKGKKARVKRLSTKHSPKRMARKNESKKVSRKKKS